MASHRLLALHTIALLPPLALFFLPLHFANSCASSPTHHTTSTDRALYSPRFQKRTFHGAVLHLVLRPPAWASDASGFPEYCFLCRVDSICAGKSPDGERMHFTFAPCFPETETDLITRSLSLFKPIEALGEWKNFHYPNPKLMAAHSLK